VSLEAWGWYASIFFWLFFTGIGLPPFPEEGGILYAAGVAAVQSDVHWWLAWPATSAGILCADMVLYGAGRWFGPRLFDYHWVQRLIKPERRLRFEGRFHEHGMKILITARFLPPLRTGVFVVAGALRYSFLRFLIADGLYLVVGVGAFFLCGNLVIHLLHELHHLIGHWTIYLVAAAVGLYLLYRYYRRLKDREVKFMPPGPVSVLEAVKDKVPVPPKDGPSSAPQPASREAAGG
jgi:membrane protein DedA with SNARE-associated domain